MSQRTDRQKFAEAVWQQGAPKREAERRHLLATGTPVKERITVALDSCGLEGPEVDVACGGVEPMVDEWETGERVPTPEQMELLADLTQYPVAFFYDAVSRGVFLWHMDADRSRVHLRRRGYVT